MSKITYSNVSLPRLKISTVLTGQVRTTDSGEFKILIVGQTGANSFSILSLNGHGTIESAPHKVLELFPWVVQDDTVMHTGDDQ